MPTLYVCSYCKEQIVVFTGAYPVGTIVMHQGCNRMAHQRMMHRLGYPWKPGVRKEQPSAEATRQDSQEATPKPKRQGPLTERRQRKKAKRRQA